MARRILLVIALVVLVLVAAYLAYDWTRPCVGGPVKQFALAILNGGSYTVRCAG